MPASFAARKWSAAQWPQNLADLAADSVPSMQPVLQVTRTSHHPGSTYPLADHLAV
jgi:hypothetical protein